MIGSEKTTAEFLSSKASVFLLLAKMDSNVINDYLCYGYLPTVSNITNG